MRHVPGAGDGRTGANMARAMQVSAPTVHELIGRLVADGALDDLLRRLGREREATAAYARALELATNPVERRFLEGRLAAHADGPPDQR